MCDHSENRIQNLTSTSAACTYVQLCHSPHGYSGVAVPHLMGGGVEARAGWVLSRLRGAPALAQIHWLWPVQPLEGISSLSSLYAGMQTHWGCPCIDAGGSCWCCLGCLWVTAGPLHVPLTHLATHATQAPVRCELWFRPCMVRVRASSAAAPSSTHPL